VRAGEVARRAGVSVETLRYYERRHLLPEPPREAGGHRRYDEDAVRFVRAIKDAQAIGFTLAEIEEYLRAVRRGRVPAPEALRVRMAAKIDEIDTRIATLRRMRDELARIVGCACESLDHCTCGAAYLARRGREATAHPAPLHVTNGESAGNTLRQTSLGGAVLPWQDVLHEGPVPAGPRRELLRARAAFLSACGWGSRATILSSLQRRDRQLLQELQGGQQVVLWFEHDLYDQLQLLDVLALAGTTTEAPELIVVGAFPGKPSFRGLGELTAQQLETLWPARVTATPGTLAAATSAWNALRRPDPTALVAHATEDVPQLPFLGPALRRLLEELPAPQDGLSGTERRTLQVIAAGADRPPRRCRASSWLGPGSLRSLRMAGSGRGPSRTAVLTAVPWPFTVRNPGHGSLTTISPSAWPAARGRRCGSGCGRSCLTRSSSPSAAGCACGPGSPRTSSSRRPPMGCASM
jgi:redox-sensitive transcriptional activator SoxR